MKSTRAYTMRTRAVSAEATRRRILQAAVELLERRLRSDIRLDDVAARARVSVQTVLRVYGTRSRLLHEALDEVVREIAQDIGEADPGTSRPRSAAGSITTNGSGTP